MPLIDLCSKTSFSKRNRTRRVNIIFIIFLRFSLICFELLRLLEDMIVHMVSNSYYPVSPPLVYCMCTFSKMYVAPLLWAGWSVLVLWFPPVRLFLSCGLLRPSVLSPPLSRWQLHAPPAQVALGPTFAWVGTLWESRLHVHRTQRPYICKGGFARLELSYLCLFVLLLSLVLSCCLVIYS